MNTLRPIDSILLLAVVILAIGEAYLIFGTLGQLPAAGAPTSGAQASGADTQTVIPPSNVLSPRGGEVVRVESDAVIVKDGNTEARIGVTHATAVVLQGARKSDAQFAGDGEAFRRESRELAQDPEKNREALTVLVAPSPFMETALSLRDITPGTFISAFVRTSGEAVKVIVIRE